MTIAAQKSITLEEFLKLPYIDESPAWEYINGVSVQKPMGGGKHSILQKRLVALIDSTNTDCEAFPELRCTPNGRSVIPDVSVVRAQQLPMDDDGEVSSGGIEFAPDWVIEVLSPNQNQTKVMDNILYCIAHGTRLGWLIDPVAKAIIVYQPAQLPRVVFDETPLSVLPEIQLKLIPQQVFAWLKHR